MLAELNRDVGRAEEIKRLGEALEQSRSELSKQKPLLSQLEVLLATEQAKTPEYERLGERIAAITAELPRYTELDELRKEIANRRTEIERLGKDYEAGSFKVKELETELEKQREEFASLQTAEAEREASSAALTRARERLAALQGLANTASEHDVLKQKLDAARPPKIRRSVG